MNCGIDEPFAPAVEAIDRGDSDALASLIAAHPDLLARRSAGGEGYFTHPYLLWFVAGNPIRSEALPANIVLIAQLLIDAARARGVESLQVQLDYALELVVSGRVARECGVQRDLIDVLVDAGASPDCLPAALAHCEDDAARRLLDRGARLTPSAAACLGRLNELATLLSVADHDERQRALVGAAIHGAADALRLVLAAGVDIDAFGPQGFHPHATALHQAVYSGSLDAVRVLVDAGARLDIRDCVHDGTPLAWATYLGRREIAAYLGERRDV